MFTNSNAAVVVAGPDVTQRAAQLGVAHQRRQVLEDHGHPDVVDRGIARGLDGAVGQGAATEDPEVSGARRVDGRVEWDQAASGGRHGA